jgi:hypothetical protein
MPVASMTPEPSSLRRHPVPSGLQAWPIGWFLSLASYLARDRKISRILAGAGARVVMLQVIFALAHLLRRLRCVSPLSRELCRHLAVALCLADAAPSPLALAFVDIDLEPQGMRYALHRRESSREMVQAMSLPTCYFVVRTGTTPPTTSSLHRKRRPKTASQAHSQIWSHYLCVLPTSI